MPALVAISAMPAATLKSTGWMTMASTPWVMTFSAWRDLVLGVVLGRLHDHLVAGGLGGLLEEGHVGVEVAKRRLLLQHEGDPLGLAGLAGVLRRG